MWASLSRAEGLPVLGGTRETGQTVGTTALRAAGPVGILLRHDDRHVAQPFRVIEAIADYVADADLRDLPRNRSRRAAKTSGACSPESPIRTKVRSGKCERSVPICSIF